MWFLVNYDHAEEASTSASRPEEDTGTRKLCGMSGLQGIAGDHVRQRNLPHEVDGASPAVAGTPRDAQIHDGIGARNAGAGQARCPEEREQSKNTNSVTWEPRADWFLFRNTRRQGYSQ